MRSDCPVSYALDFIGDKWTLLIIRDMMEGKSFYKDFLNAKEGIATNILSDRLKKLESHEIIQSQVFEQRKTMKQYTLTRKGKDLIPVVVEMMIWSDKYKDQLAVSDEFIRKAKSDRPGLISAIESNLV